jgi:hypothetical protein
MKNPASYFNIVTKTNPSIQQLNWNISEKAHMHLPLTREIEFNTIMKDLTAYRLSYLQHCQKKIERKHELESIVHQQSFKFR